MPGACMVLGEGELRGVDPDGWYYDGTPAECSGGVVKIEGHGRFTLEETQGELEAYSHLYLSWVPLEACPF